MKGALHRFPIASSAVPNPDIKITSCFLVVCLTSELGGKFVQDERMMAKLEFGRREVDGCSLGL